MIGARDPGCGCPDPDRGWYDIDCPGHAIGPHPSEIADVDRQLDEMDRSRAEAVASCVNYVITGPAAEEEA